VRMGAYFSLLEKSRGIENHGEVRDVFFSSKIGISDEPEVSLGGHNRSPGAGEGPGLGLGK